MNCISAYHPRTSVVRWTGLLLCALCAMLCLTSLSLHAQTLDNALINGLASEDSDKRIEAIDQLGVIASPEAFKILNALNADQLQATPDGKVLLVDENSVAHDPLTGAVEPLPEGSDSVEINTASGVISNLRWQPRVSSRPTSMCALRPPRTCRPRLSPSSVR